LSPALSENLDVDIGEILNTPKDNDDIISVCDTLITSLKNEELNANCILSQLKNIQKN